MRIVMPPGTPELAVAIASRGVSPNDVPARGAWLREMENAQVDAWLTHETSATASKPEAPVRRTPIELPLGLKMTEPGVATKWPSALQVPASLFSTSPDGLKAQPQNSPTDIQPKQASGAWHGTAATLSTNLSHDVKTASELAMPSTMHPEAVVGAEAATATRNPMRVHAQDSPEGLQLWIGLDEHDQVKTQTVVADIMAKLEKQGIRLARLICNGRVVYEAATFGDSQDNQSPLTPPIYSQES